MLDVAVARLLRAHAADDDRIDRLEVARVERERHVHRVAVRIDAIGREAEVVLDVAAAERLLGLDVLELTEQIARRAACRICSIVVRRPRCAMPSTASIAPSRAVCVSTRSSSGIRLSLPSSENRFVPGYFVWQNRSNCSALMSSASMRVRTSAGSGSASAVSMRSASQLRRAGDEMCMNSRPDRARVDAAAGARRARRASRAACRARRSARSTLVEVRVGEAPRRGIELDDARGLEQAERIEVRGEVTAAAIRVDERPDRRLRLRGRSATS